MWQRPEEAHGKRNEGICVVFLIEVKERHATSPRRYVEGVRLKKLKSSLKSSKNVTEAVTPSMDLPAASPARSRIVIAERSHT